MPTVRSATACSISGSRTRRCSGRRPEHTGSSADDGGTIPSSTDSQCGAREVLAPVCVRQCHPYCISNSHCRPEALDVCEWPIGMRTANALGGPARRTSLQLRTTDIPNQRLRLPSCQDAYARPVGPDRSQFSQTSTPLPYRRFDASERVLPVTLAISSPISNGPLDGRCKARAARIVG